MFETQQLGKVCQVAAYEIEGRRQPLLRRVVVEDSFQFFDFGAKLLKLARKFAVFGNGRRVFQIVCDSSRDAGLLGELVLLQAQPLIILNALRDIALHVPKLFIQIVPPGSKSGKPLLKTRCVAAHGTKLGLYSSERVPDFGNGGHGDGKFAFAQRTDLTSILARVRDKANRGKARLLLSRFDFEFGGLAAQPFKIGYFLAQLLKLPQEGSTAFIKSCEIGFGIIDGGKGDRLWNSGFLEKLKHADGVLGLSTGCN